MKSRFEIQAEMSPIDLVQRQFLKEWRTIAYCDGLQQAQRLIEHKGLRVIDTEKGSLLQPAQPEHVNVVPLLMARFG